MTRCSCKTRGITLKAIVLELCPLLTDNLRRLMAPDRKALVTFAVLLFSFRINIGGKVLTNHLKEVISYRQLMVMDETYVINQLKEDVCYISTQYDTDMKTSR